MRSLGIFGIVSVILFSVLGIYSCTVLQQYNEVTRRIEEDRREAIAALREIGSPATPATFTKPKFEAWLRVREGVAAVVEEGRKDTKAIEGLLLKRVGNDALQKLAESLRTEKLGFVEYCDLQARWRALVARPECATLREAWNRRVRVAESPEPLALPAPAGKVSDVERALLKTHEARLIASLPADTLTKLLESIREGGDEQPKRIDPADSKAPDAGG